MNREVFDQICERIGDGETLSAICREPNMPARRTVYDWMEADAEAAAQFGRARDRGFDAIADSTVGIADDCDDDPASRRVRVETRLKLLAKWDPRRYGDRMQVAGDAGQPLTVVVRKLTDG